MQSAAERGANDTQPPMARLAALLGSAVSLTGITAALYLIGLVYGQGYFGRFGVQFTYLSLPTSFYLYRTILPVVLVIAVFGVVVMIGFDKPNTALQALAGNYPALASIIIILFSIVATSVLSKTMGVVVTLIILFLSIIYISIRHHYSMMHSFRQRSLGPF